MKIKNINIGETLKNAEELLEADKQISSALKAMFKLLITIITLLSGRLSLNSRKNHRVKSGFMPHFFHTDEHRELFLNRLADIHQRFSIQIHAYRLKKMA